ncbi:MAG: thioredoxin fold domain-containing protein [Cyanobacteria bacterium SZAS-4]|nr:thioredoxin fold domain-containing protein [Cyanobacteria bacterium SZAS-4]
MVKLYRYSLLMVLSCVSIAVNTICGASAARAAVDSLKCGKACIARGQYKRAVSDLQVVVKNSPKSCEGHLLLGQVYCKLKDYNKAKEQLRLAIRVGHGSTNAQKANVEIMKLPQDLIAPKTGPDTQKLVSMLDLPVQKENESKPTIIDFYATWCNPCQQLHTTLEKAKTEYGDKINFLRVDVDDAKNQKLLDQYDISPIPTIVYLNTRGEVVSFSIGFSGETIINDEIKKILVPG